jgi:hypothetical protein
MIEEPALASSAAGRLRALLESRRRRAATERCEFCGAEIAPEHGHVVNVAQRALLCVCRPCYLLFTQDGAGGARFRAVPTRYLELPSSTLSGSEWDALPLPVGVAFFFFNSLRASVTAFYPSPAGATESELPLESWQALVQAWPALATMAPDVEALLVRRSTSSPGSPMPEAVDRDGAFLVPIDACYELVGTIRREWRGFQGGDAAWSAVDAFFARVRELAATAGGR